jgi:hypothetical protein
MQNYLENYLLLSRPTYYGRYLLSDTGLCPASILSTQMWRSQQVSNYEYADRSFSGAIGVVLPVQIKQAKEETLHAQQAGLPDGHVPQVTCGLHQIRTLSAQSCTCTRHKAGGFCTPHSAAPPHVYCTAVV